jgi:hypothetical protein
VTISMLDEESAALCSQRRLPPGAALRVELSHWIEGQRTTAFAERSFWAAFYYYAPLRRVLIFVLFGAPMTSIGMEQAPDAEANQKRGQAQRRAPPIVGAEQFRRARHRKKRRSGLLDDSKRRAVARTRSLTALIAAAAAGCAVVAGIAGFAAT